MKYSREDTTHKVILTLSEDLTLPHAEQMKDLLLDTVGAGKHVGIRFKNVADIDLSLLQLLCSAHRTAMRLNTEFTIDGPVPDIWQRIVADAGFVRHTGCRLNETQKGCLWLGGDVS